jgi:hypothetical protein
VPTEEKTLQSLIINNLQTKPTRKRMIDRRNSDASAVGPSNFRYLPWHRLGTANRLSRMRGKT